MNKTEMRSLDEIKEEQEQNAAQLLKAFKGNDDKELVKAFAAFASGMQEQVLAKARGEFATSKDDTVLAKRGVRVLTTTEKAFYEKAISQMKEKNFTGMDEALPETIVDQVIQDMKQEHPLLDLINFVNAKALTKIILNRQGVQRAAWGELDSEITKELSGSVEVMEMTLCKLTAFMPMSQDMLELGPEWVDAYVRSTLSEALAVALEDAIVDGDGKNKPIGMTRDVSDDVTVTGGVYPRKEAIVLTEISPSSYAGMLASMSRDRNDKPRKIAEIILVVNPTDYFSRVYPATTIQRPDGTYANDCFPFPTKVIPSISVPDGCAVFGLSKCYGMGIGTAGKSGRIESSSEYKWLEDVEVYKAKLHGMGRPMDNNAFIYANISGLKPNLPEINVAEVKGTVKTKEQA